jgi:hypothetical protein
MNELTLQEVQHRINQLNRELMEMNQLKQRLIAENADKNQLLLEGLQ